MVWRASIGAIVLASVLSIAAAYAEDKGGDGSEQSLIQQGYAISPIPRSQLKMAGKDPELVGLGSYLVNAAADCNGCHSFPRFLNVGDNEGKNPLYNDPYSGAPTDQPLTNAPLHANFNVTHFLAGGRCFGGFMARNITPDGSGRPLGLTLEEFFRVMRTGEDVACKKNSAEPICALGTPGANDAELQTMSWPTYHGMTDRHLTAIYTYLSAIPHAEACNTVTDGCPGFSGLARLIAPKYAYANTNDCPNPPPPQ